MAGDYSCSPFCYSYSPCESSHRSARPTYTHTFANMNTFVNKDYIESLRSAINSEIAIRKLNNLTIDSPSGILKSSYMDKFRTAISSMGGGGYKSFCW